MSWWTDIRDWSEAALLGPAAGEAWDRVGNQAGAAFNKITGHPSAEDRRNQANLINEQVKAYQDQTALTRSQLDQTRAQTLGEKRRIEEKQIRALRGNYRAQNIGLLGVGSPATSDMNSKLGG